MSIMGVSMRGFSIKKKKNNNESQRLKIAEEMETQSSRFKVSDS